MAIVAADVLSPTGQVNGSVWFPALSSGEVTTLLTGFITDAYTRTDDDDAAALWVYYRAATAVADRMTSSPASTTKALVDQGSRTTTTLKDQINYWVQKAAAYLAAFESANAEDGDEDVSGWSVLRSLRHA